MSPRLFLSTLSTEARKWMSYRVDFWLTAVVGFFVNFGLAYFLWASIYTSAEQQVAGYDFDSMVLYYVLAILIAKLVRGSDRIADIAEDIYQGGLSRYLVYPTSYFGFKYSQHLGQLVPAAVQLILFGVVYGFLIPLPEGVTVGPAAIGMAVISILIANLLFYGLCAPLQLVAFWADNVWSLVVMMRFVTGLLGGAMLPLALFPQWSRELLWWLPFRFLFDFPIRVSMGQVSFSEWLTGVGIGCAWCLLTALLTRAVWRRGLLEYSGVGI